ncbi:MAG: hypothetical protein ACI87O_002172 [Planctomycetota bacterium]|jgi:hypothetical protein
MSDSVVFTIGCLASFLCIAFAVLTIRELQVLGQKGDLEKQAADSQARQSRN